VPESLVAAAKEQRAHHDQAKLPQARIGEQPEPMTPAANGRQ
jgi:hypothetical protein